MTDQKIFSLMLKTPNIRAVQIADALDQTLTAVSAALRGMVDAGDVLSSKGVAPNNVTCMVYNISDDGKLSSDYRAAYAMSLRASGPVAPAAVAVAVAMPAPVPAPEPIPAPMPAPTVAIALTAPAASIDRAAPTVPAAPTVGFVSSGTRVDRAIEFIHKNGGATNAQLRTAMGLQATQSPGQFLKPATKNGRIVYSDMLWSLGNRAPVAAAAPVVVPVPTSALLPVVAPAVAVAPATAALVQAVPASLRAATVYRCGLWSDGALELQRDGVTVAMLSHEDGEQMAGVIIRMLRDPLGLVVQTPAQAKQQATA